VGEFLFRQNFPTSLMYLIVFRRPDRLVCDHTQNDGLVRRFFLQCRYGSDTISQPLPTAEGGELLTL